MNIKDFINSAYHNRVNLEREGTYSCYSCQTYGTIEQIEEWVDKGQTALCPRCEIDSLLPGKVEPKLLEQICLKAFTPVQK